MSSRAHPRLVLTATAVLAAALGAGTVVAIGAVGGPDGSDRPDRSAAASEEPADRAAAPAPVAFAAAATGDLRAASSCAELLDHYVARGLEHVGATGWRNSTPVLYHSAARDLFSANASTQRTPGSATGTNVQEGGVDEPDLVKTDGELLVRLGADGVLVVADVTGATVTRLGEVDLGSRFGGGQLLLVGDAAVALTRSGSEVEVTTIDLSAPELPTIAASTSFDGELVEARQHGSTVRLVLAAPLPDLDFEQRWGRQRPAARQHNRALVRETMIQDWLPTITVDGRTEPLLDCADVALPSRADGLGTVSVVGLDPHDQTASTVTAVAAPTDLAYVSADRLFLATSEQSSWGWDWAGRACCYEEEGPVTGLSTPDGRVTVHAFDLVGTATTYAASGQVDGTLADRWSMDEYDGVLRLAVEHSRRTEDATSVLTLEQRGDALVEIGRVEAIGRREDLKAVRWSDGLALLVTFRRIDPVHAVDLTDPRHPRDLGELEVPGFSEYLHPLGPHRVIGLGEGPGEQGWGAQAGLFDVTDVTALRRDDVHTLEPNTRFAAATDPRQATWLPEQRTLVTVVERGWNGERGRILALHVEDGHLTERVLATLRTPTALVRAVPLADGRVVLSTEEAATFLDV